jgi:hypothetical protein
MGIAAIGPVSRYASRSSITQKAFPSTSASTVHGTSPGDHDRVIYHVPRNRRGQHPKRHHISKLWNASHTSITSHNKIIAPETFQVTPTRKYTKINLS